MLSAEKQETIVKDVGDSLTTFSNYYLTNYTVSGMDNGVVHVSLRAQQISEQWETSNRRNGK